MMMSPVLCSRIPSLSVVWCGVWGPEYNDQLLDVILALWKFITELGLSELSPLFTIIRSKPKWC